ncbi:17-beta-hydroxysteroid dehydrogenase 13-like [Contarinia nasturtii]|uniref:17-beta-hydroxysteroid dehydrogenase 13-like n=1 Tax=Contarinia nasturtii TaxID=265458 RepID=UPI0012D4915E|nr:17-beta-hydroxysteroid dehydrogenase 13-like [Contarinia nasturtii]
MDDVHSFHTRKYEKADELQEPNFIRKSLVLLQILPGLVLKTLIIVVLELYYLLLAVFHLIVPKPLKEIRGKLAVVTGGSNGIGREICLELARSGCNVACLDVDFQAAEKLCIELKRLGVNAKGYQVDVTSYDELENVKKQINADLGIVDILVNNAGLMPKNSFREGEASEIIKIISTNVMSHFWTTRIFIDDMIARRSGLIVAISSMIAFYPMSIAVTYTTSKYAVKGFMDALHQDSRHENWGVSTLTIFPHVCNTRKEIIDYIKKKVSKTTLERVGLLNPVDVGRETVRAIQRGDRYCTVPRFYLLVGKFFQSLPPEVQDFADSMFMPRVNSKTNHCIDNGFNKSQ